MVEEWIACFQSLYSYCSKEWAQLIKEFLQEFSISFFLKELKILYLKKKKSVNSGLTKWGVFCKYKNSANERKSKALKQI